MPASPHQGTAAAVHPVDIAIRSGDFSALMPDRPSFVPGWDLAEPSTPSGPVSARSGRVTRWWDCRCGSTASPVRTLSSPSGCRRAGVRTARRQLGRSRVSSAERDDRRPGPEPVTRGRGHASRSSERPVPSVHLPRNSLCTMESRCTPSRVPRTRVSSEGSRRRSCRAPMIRPRPFGRPQEGLSTRSSTPPGFARQFSVRSAITVRSLPPCPRVCRHPSEESRCLPCR